LYFGKKDKQVLDIDRLFGSAKFDLQSSLSSLMESATRILKSPVSADKFIQKDFLKSATDIIAIERSLAIRMLSKWVPSAVPSSIATN
jgi:hypothetical protein